MMPRLTLAKFVEFAGQNFPSEFARLAKIDQYTFKIDSLNTTNGKATEVNLLHIGRYHFQNTKGPLAWAHATAGGIKYYYYEGRYRSIQEVSECNHGRIYYLDAPFRQIVSSSDAEYSHTTKHGHNPKLKVWQGIAETVVYFMFLWTGRLSQVDCDNGAEMLANFKVACTNFGRNAEAKYIPPLLPPTMPGLESRYSPESHNTPGGLQRSRNSRGASCDAPIGGEIEAAKQSKSTSVRKGNDKQQLAILSRTQRELHSLQERLRVKEEKLKSRRLKLRKEKKKRRTVELYIRDRDIQIEIVKRENITLKKDLAKAQRSRQHYLNKCEKNSSQVKTREKVVGDSAPLQQVDDDFVDLARKKGLGRGIKAAKLK
ncbi:hypothetical protein NX059_000708 [Plenodomus lindquistii]|nr:hypothetical protein NX059_000708 [Plenodomus lindquistii]